MTGIGRGNGLGRSGFEDPAVLHAALGDPRLAWVWLVLRVAVGWLWLDAGWRGLQGAPTGSQAVAIGQTLAGIALILGAFAGLTAFTGGCLAIVAPVSSGPTSLVVFALVVWLVLAWKTAGWIGLDRWLLPLVGMPWRGGALLGDAAGHDGRGIVRRHALRRGGNGSVER